eukprot:gene26223-47299_t
MCEDVTVFSEAFHDAGFGLTAAWETTSVGALDGLMFSNTFVLERYLNWTGVKGMTDLYMCLCVFGCPASSSKLGFNRPRAHGGHVKYDALDFLNYQCKKQCARVGKAGTLKCPKVCKPLQYITVPCAPMTQLMWFADRSMQAL